MDGKFIRGILIGGLITYLANRSMKKMDKSFKKDMAEKAFKAMKKIVKV
ncbi:hypothetical protein [Caldanaerobius polysaccharolyticus]|nr:hypothetical protein [Caldanaerobius polysaccharolyticus]